MQHSEWTGCLYFKGSIQKRADQAIENFCWYLLDLDAKLDPSDFNKMTLFKQILLEIGFIEASGTR